MSAEKESSSWGDWKLWAGAGAAVAAAVAGVYWLRSQKQEYEKEKKKGHGKKKRRKVKAEPEQEQESKSSAPAMEFPSNNELMQYLMMSMEVLQQRADTTGAQEQQLLQWIQHLDPDMYDTRARLVAAQWLILYHTIKSLSARTPEEYSDTIRSQKGDMQVAWDLLDCESDVVGDERNAIDLLRLDVAQRLKHRDKMLPVFERVVARGPNMGYEEIIVAFTTAPLLGRWQLTRELGARILSQRGNLEEFHRAALNRPDIPDYEVLYELAEEEASRGDMPPEDLKWQTLLIKSLTIRLSSVLCDDAAKAAEVENAFDPENKREWKEIPVGRDTRMLRFGGIAQMLSLSRVPIPMVGPANDRRMKVRGYAMLQPQDGRVKQTEAYLLHRTDDGEGTWEGTYSLIQEPIGMQGGNLPKVEITFDMRMELEEIDD